MLDKANHTRKIRQVAGTIPIFHRYTLGVAGERFFKAMRDNQQLLASPCPQCADFLLPPKMYCERCFEETSSDWLALEGPGYVRSFTVLHRDLEEQPLETPVVVAMVSWPEARGGLIHRLGDIDPAEVELGMEVEPVWSEERTGAMSDITHFRPVTE
ncbi:MAG: Zn-ribbon domain-containing OB-fold protein [Chloroflexi bacterium]|nr:Zn-ribbon domain-containing OB-fold protein [Chloroflexota bacterium]MDA1271373.1 Zn-ribbon domain-containing OB-fold protein [Chloroflexota bacterium]